MDKSPDQHEYCTGGFDPEDIIISGMAGRFPECDTVGELKEGLYGKKNLIVFSDTRFKKGTLGVPYNSCALIKGLDKFDAEFFQCPNTLVNQLDPACRLHMEVTYEAIADAGIDASDLREQRIGIFNATVSRDSNKICNDQEQYHNLTSLLSLNPNRTSYAMGFTGPSMVVDSASSSSGVAFWSAVQSLQAGCVEAAVVSGCQLNLHPHNFLEFIKLGVLSPTGTSQPFDSKADGFIKAESVCAIFLQKAKTARRAYACVKATRFYSAGYVPEGISVPSKSQLVKIMTDTLNDAKVHPDEIQFVEGHAAGTQVGDPVEVTAMDEVFSTETRKEPLLLGSVKCNIGHTEACSGLCSVIKSLIAFENELIPPNINYGIPNPASPALVKGRVVIATEPIPLTSDYIPINSLGLGGTLVEVILKKNPKTYNRIKSASSVIPRVVLFPATSEEAITTVFEYVKNNPDLPEEFFALLSKLSFTDPFFKPFRGYAVYQEGTAPTTQTKSVAPVKKQVWFIMAGMNCEWSGMGLQLMKIDEFSRSMNKSAEIIKEYGINLLEVLTPNKNYFQTDRNITTSFVAICSIQIALVDLLKLLGIKPDGIIGHGCGELAASYCDGACTQEQTLIASYLRGCAVENANLPEIGMADIGVSWSQAEEMCPENVFPTCDNAEDSTTISGLKESVSQFVQKLKQDSVSVRMVDAHEFGSHCKLVYDAAIAMKLALMKLIPNPNPRSQRWISTSYPESRWSDPNCRVCGPDYFCNNLISGVRLADALKKIPSEAVVIEIGPQSPLQSILKTVVGPGASYHVLMQRNDEDSMLFFLESLGKLYQAGVNPKIEQLYPSVKFPVPRGTPSISDLIKWNHSQSFNVPKYSPKTSHFSRKFQLENADAYLLDHVIDCKTQFPGLGYILIAWEALAAKHQKNFEEMSIVIENFKIERTIYTDAQTETKFFVNIFDSSGQFEILEGKSLVAKGTIYETKENIYSENLPEYISDGPCVSGGDIYDELKRSSYEYGAAFQSIIEYSIEGASGLIEWKGKWIPFFDAIFQFFILKMNKRGLLLPSGAMFFKIDPNVLRAYIRKNGSLSKDDKVTTCNIPCSYNPKTKLCRSIGVEVCHLHSDPAPVRGNAKKPILEEYRFFPYSSNYAPTERFCPGFAQYFRACNESINNIRKALKIDIKKYQFQVVGHNDLPLNEVTSSDGRNLLKVLKDISKDPESLQNNRKGCLTKYSRMAGTDILNSALLNEDSLKVMLALIMENSWGKLSVVEINRNFPVVLFLAIETIWKYAYLNFKESILIAPKAVEIDQEVLENYGIQKRSEDILINLKRDSSRDVAISSFICCPLSELRNLLRTLTSILKPNGFILLFLKEKCNRAEQFLSSICGEDLPVISQKELESVLQSENLLILSKISDPFGGSVYLLRAPYLETPHKVLQVTDGSYEWVEKVKKRLCEIDSGMLWLVSEGSHVNGILGMVSCLKQEFEGERIRCVFISHSQQEKTFPSFSLEHPFFKNLIRKNLVMNVCKNGTWGSYRYILMKQVKPPRPVEHSYLNIRKYGDLSSFEWIESSVKYSSRQNKKLVHIYYSALNFKDVMLATGNLSTPTTMGLEFSGREEGTGKRICGMAPAGAIATAILIEPSQCLEVPENWTLEEAATVPVVYATCYYSLLTEARLKPGESILIHSGDCEIGTAAIAIALSMDCQVFTTVGRDEKRDYLKRKFPKINKENIGRSGNISFETLIISRTNKKGVDVILNSLAKAKFDDLANFRCIARRSRIIEIGKCDLELQRPINSNNFFKNITFHCVYLDQLFDIDPRENTTISEILDMIRKGIKNGVVKPLDRTVFGRNTIEDAFGYMSKENHLGKVLLKIRDEEPEKNSVPKTMMLPAVPDTQFYHNKSYIIIGGLGGFGMEVANWAIDKGARNIILTSRYGARTPYHHFCFKRWKDKGINIQVSTLNLVKREEAEKLLLESMRIGPLGGIFNSSVILKDAFMEMQTPENYRDVCGPKAEATKNLDQLTRRLCPDIDYFVCFSSLAAGRGNAGQSNYGYANSVMERICEERKKEGLHGLAIQWGFIGETGAAHRRFGDEARIMGVMAQSVKSCLWALDVLCQQDCPVMASYVVPEQNRSNSKEDPLQTILKILGIEDISQINLARNFREIGIDSLVGVEIQQFVKYYSNVDLSIQKIQEMKFDDFKSIFQKTDSQKTTAKAPALKAAATIKLPPTLVHKDPLVVLNKEAFGKHLFIVHIKDTDVMSFQPLAKALKRPVHALVWTKSSPSTDMKSLAQWYLKAIQSVTDGPYHLIGISECACLAIEMAIQSEKMKSLTLINGSMHLMKTVNMDNDEKSESDVHSICSFVEQFTSSDISKLNEELQKGLSLRQMMESVFKYLKNSCNHDVNKKEVFEAVMQQIRKYRLLKFYIPSGKVSKDINLLEDPFEILPNDVPIIKEKFIHFCSGKVAVYRKFSPLLLSSEDGIKRLATTLQKLL